jgi:hypothetical protein
VAVYGAVAAAVEAVAAEVEVSLNVFWAKYFPVVIICKFPENFSQSKICFLLVSNWLAVPTSSAFLPLTLVTHLLSTPINCDKQLVIFVVGGCRPTC